METMDGTKVCSRCGEDKPLEDYYKQQLTKRAPYCKLCRKTALSASRRKNRARLRAQRAETRVKVNALKMTLTCVDCGWGPRTEGECWRLHFDHIDPSTKYTSDARPSGAFRREWPWDRILAEIALCVPRCGSCHAYRTVRQMRGLDPYPLPSPFPSAPPHPQSAS